MALRLFASRAPMALIMLSRGLACLALALLAVAVSGPASADDPMGTVSCSVVGATMSGGGLWFRPYIGIVARNVRVRVTNSSSACDASGVTGGKAPITEVLFKFSGRMPDATCATFTSTPQFENGRIKIKWRGLNPAGHEMTVAVSRAVLAGASFDSGSDSLILTTSPIDVGAFLGASATLHLGFGDMAEWTSVMCPTNNMAGLGFGEPINVATIDVQ